MTGIAWLVLTLALAIPVSFVFGRKVGEQRRDDDLRGWLSSLGQSSASVLLWLDGFEKFRLTRHR